MSERPTSFSQILAPLERTKESLSMSQKKISGGVVHQVPADLKKALNIRPESVNSMGGYYTARTQRVDMLD